MLFLSFGTLAHAVQVTSTWTGAGDGTTYTDAANWSTPNFPRNGTPAGTTYRAVVDGNNGKVANVNFNTSVTIDALVVTQGDSFNINSGTSLVVINSGAGAGTIVNSGTIRITAGASGAALLRIDGDVELSGGGTVTMTDPNPNVNSNGAIILGTAVTNRLTNVDNTISGAGSFGNGQMVFTNRGTIIANNASKPLIINPTVRGTDNVNSGTLRANGGILNFQFHTINNSGGTIEALNGSVVELRSPTINGGTLQTTGTGVIRTTDLNGLPTLANLTTKGKITIPSSTSLVLIGNIVNNGTIAINEIGDGAARLFISGDVNLSGGGTVTLADKASGGSLLSAISGRSATDRLTNADNTISGAGAIGDGQMLLTNTGTIVAQGTNPLVIRLSAGSNVNTSNLRADGGTLILFGSSLANSGGTIEARAASRVTLVGTAINGGTLTTVGTGLVVTDSISSPTNTPVNNVTNAGNLVVSSSSSLTLGGTITNRGTIAVNGTNDSNGSATLRISESVTLNGGGTVTLADKASAGSLLSGISGTTATARLTNADNTISGAGAVQDITLINNGTILPIGQNPLLFLSPLTNNSTLRVDAGNTLRINTGLTLTQAAGLLLVNGTFDSIINGPGTVAVTGGTLAGTGTIANNVTNSGGTVSPGNFVSPGVSSIGILTINGRYTQSSAGRLFIQLAGSEAGSGFDQLLTNNVADFDGILDVKLEGAYAPALDTAFKIVTYSSRGQRMGVFTLNRLDNDSRGGFTQQYNATDLTLISQGTPTIGVNLQPTQVFTNTVLTATVVTAPSTPASGVTYDFRVNGVSKQSGSSNTYDLGVASQGDKNDVISVLVRTDDDRSNQNSVTIQNTKPSAQSPADSSARGGELISIPLAGSDLDGDALTLRIVSGSRNGSASIRRLDNGSFVLDYTARPFFNGSEAIQFIANDGQGDSALARLTINVTSPIPPVVNRAPVAFSGGITLLNASAGQEVNSFLSAIDPDPEDTIDTLFFRITQQPTSGTIADISLVDGHVAFRYVPNPGFFGVDSFKYVAVDKANTGLISNEATYSIRIIAPPTNRAPVAFSDGTATANAGQVTDIVVGVTDSDAQDTLDTLFFRTVRFPTKGTLQRVFLRDGNPFFSYLPNAGASGTDSFSFVVIDKGGNGLTSNEATVSIQVTNPAPANRAPVAFSSSVNVRRGQLNFQVDLPLGAIDPDGDAITFRIVNNPRFGQGQIMVADDGRAFYRYVDTQGFIAPDSVTFVATDSKGAQSNEATISILNVNDTPVNRAPVAFSSGTAMSLRNGIVDILASAIDPDAEDTIDTLTFKIVQGPTRGRIQEIVRRDGRVYFRFVPNFFQNPLPSNTDVIKFAVVDKNNTGLQSNTATITLTISDAPIKPPAPGPNRAPVITQPPPTVAAPFATQVSFLINAFDPDGDDFEYVILERTNNGVGDFDSSGYFVYTNSDANRGSDTIRFVAIDDKGARSNEVTLVIARPAPNQPNQAPSAANASASTVVGVPIDIPITAFDRDGDRLEFTFPNNATSAANGGRVEFLDTTGGPMLRYTPGPNFVGVDRVGFRVRDGKPITGPEVVGVVTITVNYPTSALRAPANKEVKSPSGGNS